MGVCDIKPRWGGSTTSTSTGALNCACIDNASPLDRNTHQNLLTSVNLSYPTTDPRATDPFNLNIIVTRQLIHVRQIQVCLLKWKLEVPIFVGQNYLLVNAHLRCFGLPKNGCFGSQACRLCQLFAPNILARACSSLIQKNIEPLHSRLDSECALNWWTPINRWTPIPCSCGNCFSVTMCFHIHLMPVHVNFCCSELPFICLDNKKKMISNAQAAIRFYQPLPFYPRLFPSSEDIDNSSIHAIVIHWACVSSRPLPVALSTLQPASSQSNDCWSVKLV